MNMYNSLNTVDARCSSHNKFQNIQLLLVLLEDIYDYMAYCFVNDMGLHGFQKVLYKNKLLRVPPSMNFL